MVGAHCGAARRVGLFVNGSDDVKAWFASRVHRESIPLFRAMPNIWQALGERTSILHADISWHDGAVAYELRSD
jgi:hypothetical protein